jgi:hypothetical protein
MKRFLLWCVCLGLLIAGGVGSTAHAQGASTQPFGFTGIWTGTLRVTPCMALKEGGRCNAINNITFTILQDGSKVSGHYTCAIGTQICRNGNADSNGKIVSGRVSGNSINFSVVLPADVSSCRYTGISPAPGQIRGGYNCYAGGSLIEQGNFEVTREGG